MHTLMLEKINRNSNIKAPIYIPEKNPKYFFFQDCHYIDEL